MSFITVGDRRGAGIADRLPLLSSSSSRFQQGAFRYVIVEMRAAFKSSDTLPNRYQKLFIKHSTIHRVVVRLEKREIVSLPVFFSDRKSVMDGTGSNQ